MNLTLTLATNLNFPPSTEPTPPDSYINCLLNISMYAANTHLKRNLSKAEIPNCTADWFLHSLQQTNPIPQVEILFLEPNTLELPLIPLFTSHLNQVHHYNKSALYTIISDNIQNLTTWFKHHHLSVELH